MAASAVEPPIESPMSGLQSANPPPHQNSGEDVIATLERLGGLMDKGYITKEEFELKKSELLSRI